MRSGTRIIVGVDRSEGSRAALSHAARQAAAHDAELVVVHAWEPAFEHVHGTETTSILRACALHQAAEVLDDVLARAHAERSWAVQRVVARPMQGEASAVLLAAVRPGDLLVVGKNRGDVVRRLLLGSVSARILRSARCPVVVVPAPRRPARTRLAELRTALRHRLLGDPLLERGRDPGAGRGAGAPDPAGPRVAPPHVASWLASRASSTGHVSVDLHLPAP